MSELADIQRALVAGKLSIALDGLEHILARRPDDIDALYMHAVACRYSGRNAQALEILARLKLLSPSHSRAHQEEGHVFRDLNQSANALQSYTRALNLNPALEACLVESIKLLQTTRQSRRLVQVQMQLEALRKLPSELKTVMELVAQNKLLKAETVCRKFLQHQPNHVRGMCLLAEIGSKLGILEDAEFLLESAVVFAPDDVQVQMDYVQILRKRQKFKLALEQAQQLLRVHPENPQIKSLCAIEYMQTGDYDTAMSLLDEVLLQVPGDARTLVNYGHALKTRGRADDAIEKYRAAVASQPRHGESYYSLANLKVYRFGDDEIALMHSLEADSNLGFMDRVYLNFALAKALEDRGEYAKAFACYERGNSLKKAQSRYDAQQMHGELAAVKTICNDQFFQERQAFGAPVADPIFIVGLPRAGSTLLEQILSSHSQVDGTLELPNILSLSQRLRRRSAHGYPHVLAELHADECKKLGKEYIEDTRIHRAGAAFFIDKMPNNFRHIGLIKMILPNAKIIDARREPMACCFSGFKQLFAEGQEFSYDLQDIGRYYNDYVDLMSHWDRVLPGFVLRIQHEDVVVDLETQVRRILTFCGLPFEEACLRFFETERDIRTPSSEQVRQPIFTEGLQQWRNFAPWLQPLQATLEDAATPDSMASGPS